MITKLFLLGVFSAVLLVTSAVTVWLYWWDKRAAGRKANRIAERTLHLWALSGGWPGALLARGRFRHKTQKQPFGVILWCTVVANLLGWCFIVWIFG